MAEKPDRNVSDGTDGGGQRIVIEQRPPRGTLFGRRVLMALLIISVFFNLSMYLGYKEYFSETEPLPEKFYSGEETASTKIALIRAEGVLWGDQTEFLLKQTKQAMKDDSVKAVVLEIDSPGGVVSDTHRVYHKLRELRESGRPIVVTMKSLAASGGYYIAMAAGDSGPILAEPSTWTGSIGVVMPHYELVGLMNNLGIQYDSISTGPLKEAGSPFHKMTPEERQLWQHVINDAFERFLTVVSEGRSDLTAEQIRELANGQIYTAEDALGHGLIDRIGYADDAIEEAKRLTGEERVRVVRYARHLSALDMLTGTRSAMASQFDVSKLLELTVPRAMYLFSWQSELMSDWNPLGR